MKDLIKAKNELVKATHQRMEIVLENKQKRVKISEKNKQDKIKFIRIGEKYIQDKTAYYDDFLKSSINHAKTQSQKEKDASKLAEANMPFLRKQMDLVNKVSRLESKYEKTSELLQEKRRLLEESSAICNIFLIGRKKFTRVLESIVIPRKKYFEAWKKFEIDCKKHEKEFVKCSNAYVQLLLKMETEEANYEKWETSHRYYPKRKEIRKKIQVLDLKIQQGVKK